MIQLAAIWIISVVAFFVLWALLAKVIKKISEKKGASEDVKDENGEQTESTTPIREQNQQNINNK